MNFKCGDVVQVINFPENDRLSGKIGVIQGHFVNCYIVQFECYTGEEWNSFVIIESCLKLVSE